MTQGFTRRSLLASALAGSAVLATDGGPTRQPVDSEQDAAIDSYQVTHGRIRQSVMGWCFNPMPAVELARHCKSIGLVAIEGVGSQHYPALRELGLEISLVGSHGFARGPVNTEHHPEVKQKLLEGIDLAAAVGSPNVITFTGMTEKGIGPEQSSRNCIQLWKEVVGYAEEKGVNLVLEHLNSRDDSHPMKGHPGYFGDDVDQCVEMIKRVGSPRMKLLFDVYHVQVMHGDVIRRLQNYQEYIGHYHTAGNPGRGELDERQELNYPAIMRAILETGYQGYVAQEFIPTWKQPIRALRHAARTCDV